MFRTLQCPSSGGANCIMQHLVYVSLLAAMRHVGWKLLAAMRHVGWKLLAAM
jgi:hypothetical protein